MAKHFSADQWRAWFVEFEQNDLTVAKFCQSVNVSVQSYYKWRKRLTALDAQLPAETKPAGTKPAGTVKPNPRRTPAPNQLARFVPVVLSDSKIEIEFPGGVIARVNNDADSLWPIVSVLLKESKQ